MGRDVGTWGRFDRLNRLRRLIGLAPLILAACAAPQPAVPPPLPPEAPPAEPAPAPYPHDLVYTASPGVVVRIDSTTTATIEQPFFPLEVLGQDSLGLLVGCGICEPIAAGRVAETEIVHTPLAPGVAALGTLGEFALAVSAAAAARDLEALRPVMAPDFFFAFVGVQTPDAAFEVWRSEDFATLDQLPALLARGLKTSDGTIWAAPTEYVETFGYRGLRLGFRERPDGRWEWLFLVRGVSG